jgi:FkbM family methyltransferase
MQLRIQSAIEQSSVPQRLGIIESRLSVLELGLSTMEPALNAVGSRLSIMEPALNAVGSRLSRLECRLDELTSVLSNLKPSLLTAIDESSIVPSFGARFDPLATRIEIMQIGLDALRLEREDHDRVLGLLGLLMSRADTVLQGSAIPLGRDVLMRTPNGFLLLPSEDSKLVSAVWASGGVLEPGTIKVLTALLREGNFTIDVGAHVGLTVFPAARKVGPTGRVLALEPGARAIGLLRQSVVLNSVSERVLLLPYAAGEDKGVARLNVGSILGHSSLLPLAGCENFEEVQVRTLDSLVPPGQSVRLAKLDAEGFEVQVWRGMQRIIAENPALAVIVEFGPEHLRRAESSVENWLGEFQAPGFTAYEVDELSGEIRRLRSLEQLSLVHSLNLLLLRQPPTAFPELLFT